MPMNRRRDFEAPSRQGNPEGEGLKRFREKKIFFSPVKGVETGCKSKYFRMCEFRKLRKEQSSFFYRQLMQVCRNIFFKFH